MIGWMIMVTEIVAALLGGMVVLALLFSLAPAGFWEERKGEPPDPWP